jgi:hypothetical protein
MNIGSCPSAHHEYWFLPFGKSNFPEFAAQSRSKQQDPSTFRESASLSRFSSKEKGADRAQTAVMIATK